jgi:hypothetical protein
MRNTKKLCSIVFGYGTENFITERMAGNFSLKQLVVMENGKENSYFHLSEHTKHIQTILKTSTVNDALKSVLLPMY